MADKMHLGDWTKQNVTIGGTGVLTLGASPGYPTLAETVGVDNRTVYTILNSNLSPLEIGYGRLINATTFEREVIRKTYFDGTYSTGDSLPPVNVPPGCVFYTGPTEDLLELLMLEMALADYEDVSGAETISLRFKAIKLNATANTTITFEDLPPVGVKYELTLHATSETHPTNSPDTGFNLTFSGASFMERGAAAAPVQLLAVGETTIRLTTVDGGATFKVENLSAASIVKDLGVLTGSINIDIRYPLSKGLLATGGSSILTVADVSPDIGVSEVAHFSILNDSNVLRYLQFDGFKFNLLNTVFNILEIPLGFAADFSVRRSVHAEAGSDLYDVWVNGISYNITASGLTTNWNPSDTEPTYITLSNQNKTAVKPVGNISNVAVAARAFGGKNNNSGTVILGFRLDQVPNQTGSSGTRVVRCDIGVATGAQALSGVYVGQTAYSFGLAIQASQTGSLIGVDGSYNNNVRKAITPIVVPAIGDIFTVKVNFATKKIRWFKNNVDYGIGIEQDFSAIGAALFPMASFYHSSASSASNTGIVTILNEIEYPYALLSGETYWES